MSAYKSVQVSFAIPGAVESAKDEITNLHDEMEEMEGNMSGTSAEHTPKYEVVTEAEQALSSAVDALENLDEGFETLLAKYKSEVIVWQSIPRRRRYNTSRATRLDNAIAIVNGLIEAAEGLETVDWSEKDKDILSAGIENLQDSLECDGIEFPGMFG